jgi:hypothetical protein
MTITRTILSFINPICCNFHDTRWKKKWYSQGEMDMSNRLKGLRVSTIDPKPQTPDADTCSESEKVGRPKTETIELQRVMCRKLV